MHGVFFDIGLGLGLAAACGLRPFLPALAAGALGSAGALDVTFAHGSFHFLQAGWWLLAVTVALVLSYVVQLLGRQDPIAHLRWRSRESPLAAVIVGLSYGVGIALFSGALGRHVELWWLRAIVAVAVVAVGMRAVYPLIAGARSRLSDRAAREALTVYLDAASLAVAALVCLLHPLGYVAVAVLAWFAWRRRARAGEKYAGLRILRRP